MFHLYDNLDNTDKTPMQLDFTNLPKDIRIPIHIELDMTIAQWFGGGGEEGQARTGDTQGPRGACPGAHQAGAGCRGDSKEAEETDRILPKKHFSEDSTGRNGNKKQQEEER